MSQCAFEEQIDPHIRLIHHRRLDTGSTMLGFNPSNYIKLGDCFPGSSTRMLGPMSCNKNHPGSSPCHLHHPQFHHEIGYINNDMYIIVYVCVYIYIYICIYINGWFRITIPRWFMALFYPHLKLSFRAMKEWLDPHFSSRDGCWSIVIPPMMGKPAVDPPTSYGDFQKWGYPNSWIVYKGKSQSKMDDLGVPPSFRTPPYIYLHLCGLNSTLSWLKQSFVFHVVLRSPAEHEAHQKIAEKCEKLQSQL